MFFTPGRTAVMWLSEIPFPAFARCSSLFYSADYPRGTGDYCALLSLIPECFSGIPSWAFFFCSPEIPAIARCLLLELSVPWYAVFH